MILLTTHKVDLVGYIPILDKPVEPREPITQSLNY